MVLPQLHIKWLSRPLSPEVMRPGREADKSPPLSVGHHIRTGFMNCTDLCPGVPQNCVRNSHEGFPSHKKYISEHVCEHFDFPTVVENIYRGRTVINWPLTSRNRRERRRFVD